jgi:hypothetical protein
LAGGDGAAWDGAEASARAKEAGARANAEWRAVAEAKARAEAESKLQSLERRLADLESRSLK